MSIHIPSEVVLFLNVCGIPYPDVDVDQVRELSQDVREFASDVRDSFDAATNTLGDMGSAMSGNSYQTIMVMWAYRQEKMADLDSALDVAATALDIAADVIEAIQIAVLIELAALAASFVAGMFTPAGAVTGPMIAAAARWLLKKVAETIMWYILGEVVAKALEPMVEKFDRLIRDSLLPPDFTLPSPGSDSKYHLDPEAVTRYAQDLEKHANEIASHGEKLGQKLDRLDLATPGLEVPAADWPYPATDEPLTVPSQPGALPSTLPSWVPDMMRTLPSWLPDMQHPSTETPAGKASDSGSSGQKDTENTAGPTGADRPSGEPQPSANTAAEVSPSATPGASSNSGGAPGSVATPALVGTDASQRAVISSIGESAGDGHVAGLEANRTDTGSTQHGAGAVDGVVPAVAAQPAAATPGQSPAASAQNNSQRPADGATNKPQAGAGRGPTGSGPGTQQSSSAPARATPWSRGGKKPARVAPAIERSDVPATATSPTDTGDRGEAVQKPQSDVNEATHVFAPDTSTPPTALPKADATGGAAERDVPAESAPVSTEPLPTGNRRPGPE